MPTSTQLNLETDRSGSVPSRPLQTNHQHYRADIDGLRAVAVIAVVAYHVYPWRLRGGFIGVDVFFVISGFLISRIILSKTAVGTFSFRDFYTRRIHRIFPALAVVTGSMFAVAWFTFDGDELAQYGKHLTAGALFVSNFVFWKENGYFDADVDLKPLLHLWSLGIEEQFYLFWPIALMALARLRIRTLGFTVAVAAVSFLWNVHLAGSDLAADFYSPASRTWELLVGALLAQRSMARDEAPIVGVRRTNLSSALGAALLVMGFLFVDARRAFPGWWALMPTIGAALLISAGPRAWINRNVLSNPAMVWLGAISFPLYLWHWPLLSFVRVLSGDQPTRTIRLTVVVLSILLAWLTYRLVETPIRFDTKRPSRTIGLVVIMLVLAAAGALSFSTGFPGRAAANQSIVNDGDLGHDHFHQYIADHFVLCEPADIRAQAGIWNGHIRCDQTRPGPIDIALVGDSHAEHLFIGLAEALKDRNLVIYSQGALPVRESKPFAAIFETLQSNRDIKVVILAAAWIWRIDEVSSRESLRSDLAATVRMLQASGKKVFLMEDTPIFDFPPKICAYAANLFHANRCTQPRVEIDAQLARYGAVFEALARDNAELGLLKTEDYFCNAVSCSMSSAGKLLFRDGNHLSINGSRYIAERLLHDHPEIGR